MKKILKKREILVHLVFFLFILSLFLFYSSKGIINLGDTNYPLDLKPYLEKFGYTWHYTNATGKDAGIGLPLNVYFQPIILLQKFKLSLQTAQGISYAFLFYLSYLFSYLLIRRGLKLGFWESLIASLFYILNPFFLGQWYVPIPWNFSSLILLPLTCLLVSCLWQKPKKLFAGLFFAFLVFSYVNPNVPLMIVVLVNLFSFIVFYGLFKERKIDFTKIFVRLLSVIVSFVASNCWWLMISMISSRSTYDLYVKSTNLKSWIEAISTISPLINIFSLRFILPYTLANGPSFTATTPFFFSPLMNILLFAFTIFIFIAPVFLFKKYKAHHYFLYFLFLFVVFLVKAFNPFFKSIFMMIFNNVPYFGMFKSAPEKFGIWLIFIWTIIIALNLNMINKTFKKNAKIVFGLLLVVLVIYAYPLYSLKLISPLKIGEFTITPFYNEKSSQKELREFLNKDPSYSRVLYFSGTDNYMVTASQENGDYFRGLDPVVSNTKKAFIQNCDWVQGLGKLLFENVSNCGYLPFLPVYDIDYILLNMENYDTKAQKHFKYYLDNRIELLKYFNLEWNKGGIYLFKIKNEFNMPKIYFGGEKVYVYGNQQSLLDIAGLSSWKLSDMILLREKGSGSPDNTGDSRIFSDAGLQLKDNLEILESNYEERASFCQQVPTETIKILNSQAGKKILDNPEFKEKCLDINFFPLNYTVDLPDSGNYKIYLRDSDGGEWLEAGSKLSKKTVLNLVVVSELGKENLINEENDIHDLSKSSVYRLDFLLPKVVAGDQVQISEAKGIVLQELPDTPQKMFTMYFSFSSLAEAGRVGFSVSSPGDYKNGSLTVRGVKKLDISLMKVAAENEGLKSEEPPKMFFWRINPTKYKVRIQGATEPFNLIFSESFSPEWKAYISDEKYLPDLTKEDGRWYLGSKIKEIWINSSLINPFITETWGKKSISEDRHFLVNGFANAWEIGPEDASGDDYEIIIEYRPQQIFYIGVAITFLTGIMSLMFLVGKRENDR